MQNNELNILDLNDLSKENLLPLFLPAHDYDVQKIIETFEKLNCAVYLTQKRIRLVFPDNINKFYEKELSLAFRRTYNSIGETLRMRNIKKLRTKGPNDWLRVM